MSSCPLLHALSPSRRLGLQGACLSLCSLGSSHLEMGSWLQLPDSTYGHHMSARRLHLFGSELTDVEMSGWENEDSGAACPGAPQPDLGLRSQVPPSPAGPLGVLCMLTPIARGEGHPPGVELDTPGRHVVRPLGTPRDVDPHISPSKGSPFALGCTLIACTLVMQAQYLGLPQPQPLPLVLRM